MSKSLKSSSFTFVDLFAGIGGTRLAFERAGGKCVFSSEWNDSSRKTYFANFGEEPHGDITKISGTDIPDHDILVAGFPCQPFSIAGVSKYRSLNYKEGFENATQGTLFFDVARILKEKRPKAFMLENVKNLRSHDGGNTFRIIQKTLRDDLGYTIYDQIMDAKTLVPQHRERIFIVGFRDPIEFKFPKLPDETPELSAILQKRVPKKYTLTDHLWEYLRKYAEKHRAKGNGFGYGLANRHGYTRTLSARYYKDGSEILIPQRGKNPRRLTPRECARLMGFPNSFKIILSDTAAYRQFGNSVVVPVVELIAKEIALSLQDGKRKVTLLDHISV